jgi:putative FmdB family regulatory protein
MPTYDFLCDNKKCNHEFEDFLSRYTAPNPPCPVCKCEEVSRLITGTVRGRVEVSGQDLAQSIKDGAAGLKRRAARDENFLGSLVGESRLNDNRTTRR